MAQNAQPAGAGAGAGLPRASSMFTPNTRLLSRSLMVPSAYTKGVQQMVTIYVGHERTEFKVHKALICSQSDFFRAALTNPGFPESRTMTVDLVEDNPDCFEVLVNWIYSGEVILPANARQQLWLKTYFLADKILMTAAKDVLLDIFMGHPDSAHLVPLSLMWQSNVEDLPMLSPLRRWLVDQISYSTVVTPDFWTTRRVQHLLPRWRTWLSSGTPLAHAVIQRCQFLRYQFVTRGVTIDHRDPSRFNRRAYFEQTIAGPLLAGAEQIG